MKIIASFFQAKNNNSVMKNLLTTQISNNTEPSNLSKDKRGKKVK